MASSTLHIHNARRCCRSACIGRTARLLPARDTVLFAGLLSFSNEATDRQRYQHNQRMSPGRSVLELHQSLARKLRTALAYSTAGFLLQSMMLTRFQGFCRSSNCKSPSLLMTSCAAGYKTPLLLLLSVLFNSNSPAVRL
jgi:hypothetical protein